MSSNKLSFDELPTAVAQLLDEVAYLKKMLQFLATQKEEVTAPSRIPISIDKVCELTRKAKPTIYSWVSKRIIPSYKRGRSLYFFEDEIIDFIEGGARKTVQQINKELDDELLNIDKHN